MIRPLLLRRIICDAEMECARYIYVHVYVLNGRVERESERDREHEDLFSGVIFVGKYAGVEQKKNWSAVIAIADIIPQNYVNILFAIVKY